MQTPMCSTAVRRLARLLMEAVSMAPDEIGDEGRQWHIGANISRCLKRCTITEASMPRSARTVALFVRQMRPSSVEAMASAALIWLPAAVSLRLSARMTVSSGPGRGHELTTGQWAAVAQAAAARGNPAVDLREILYAIRYVARSAGGSRMLPTNFGPWQTVCWWFGCFVRLPLFHTIHDIALIRDRKWVGCEAIPSAAVIASQTVKAPAAHVRGYDANKMILGRKRHIAVGADGRLLMVNLTTADVADRTGAQEILGAIRKRWAWVKHLFAAVTAPNYSTRPRSSTSWSRLRCIGAEPGFKVLPRRRVVERTFGCISRWRQLARDFEQRLDVSEAMIRMAMGSLLLRRIAHQ